MPRLIPSLASAPASAPAPVPAEGGALYALGLIHTNHGHDVRQFLLESLRSTQHEVRCRRPAEAAGGEAWLPSCLALRSLARINARRSDSPLNVFEALCLFRGAAR
jgi:hypothetical protein